MTYGGAPYAGGPYAGELADAADIPTDGNIRLAVEVAFTTDALSASPAFVDIGGDCRTWDTTRGRNGELERFQPGRATAVLSNRERQYDSQNAAGPWFGNLKPNRRMRIRETLNGVTYTQFDGYVDRWLLDYPDTGKDATATVVATDGMKFLARTDLPTSVYDDLILSHSPSLYLRMDESKQYEEDASLVALNKGTLGTAGNGTYVGPPVLEAERLVVNDPGTSMEITNSNETPSTGLMGVRVPFDILGGGTNETRTFVFEAWVIPTQIEANNIWVFSDDDGDAQINFIVGSFFRFSVTAGGFTSAVDSASPLASHKRYHLVAKHTRATSLELWVNGVRSVAGYSLTAIGDQGPNLHIGYNGVDTGGNWAGKLSHAAVYIGAAADAVDQAWVDSHYAAGTHPWQDDLPGTRYGRILDLALWPAGQRDIDPGVTTLQSAELGPPPLEIAQKIAETEYASLFWMDREGKATFVDRTAVFAREPAWTFGDAVGEIGYRELEPDDGDGAIRNRASISRLGGLVKTVEDAGSIDEYGPSTYALEGLMHRTEAQSTAHAQFIIDQYSEPSRRIARLAVGPPVVGQEALVWPAVLGPELGQAVTVKHSPIGGGARFSQVCVIEGIQHRGQPGENRSVSLILSPEYIGV